MTANAQRGKRNRNHGNEGEQAAARYLRSCDWSADTARNRSQGKQSLRGDIVIDDAPHVTFEVKATERPAVAKWLAQLDEEAAGLPCKALVWWHPSATRARPGEWLTFVANHPFDWWWGEVHAPRDFCDGDLTVVQLRAAIGWLDVEHAHRVDGSGCPMLFWDSVEHGEWLLMRFASFVDEVLPRWEGT